MPRNKAISTEKTEGKQQLGELKLVSESVAWATVSSIVKASYKFWKDFLVLRRGPNATDQLTQADDKEFIYAIRAVTLALLPPLTVDDDSGNASFPQAVGFVNSGPNPIYLNWMDCSPNEMRNALITSFTPQIGSSLRCLFNDGTPFLACGWNFTGYKILC